MTVQALATVRERFLPMLRFAAEEYRLRAPTGYPVVVDTPEAGTIGIELDPSYALYIVSDGADLYADYYFRSARTDARSSASREKFGGLPFPDRRPLDSSVSDQQLRNLLAELMAIWNSQPGLIHISDS